MTTEVINSQRFYKTIYKYIDIANLFNDKLIISHKFMNIIMFDIHILNL